MFLASRAAAQDAPSCQAQAAGQGWSITENWAWGQICQRQPIAFAKLAQGANQAQNTIGSVFLQAILMDPALAKYTALAPLQFVNAYFQKLDIEGGSVPALSLTDCTAGGPVTLAGIRIAQGLTLQGLKSTGAVEVREMSSGSVAIDALSAGSLRIRNSKLDKLSVSNSALTGALDMDNVDVAGRLELTRIASPHVLLQYAKANVLAIYAVTTGYLGLSHVTDGRVGLWATTWQGPSTRLDLRDLNATRLDWSFPGNGGTDDRPDIPGAVGLSDVAADAIYVGNDPAPVMQAVSQIADAPGIPSSLYVTLAKTYADRGFAELARQLTFQKNSADYRKDTFFPWPLHKCITLLLWLFFGYGLYPEVGLLWIAFIVFVASWLLRMGAAKVIEGKPPNNWLLFTADAVLPGIELDPDHRDVRFAGWRQYLLYGVRLLGAAVLFIFLRLLQQSAGPASGG